jgi:hypothetical protein
MTNEVVSVAYKDLLLETLIEFGGNSSSSSYVKKTALRFNCQAFFRNVLAIYEHRKLHPSPAYCYFLLLRPNYLHDTLFSNIFSLRCSSLNVRGKVFTHT